MSHLLKRWKLYIHRSTFNTMITSIQYILLKMLEPNKLFSPIIKIFVKKCVQVNLDHNSYYQTFQKIATLCV